MALHFDLRVNDNKIGYFEAVRVSGGSDPDDVNRYVVRVWRKELGGKFGEAEIVQVEHRYGDGAWVLIRKALEAING